MLRGMNPNTPTRYDGTPTSRFWAKVRKSEGCWEWVAARDKKGYGRDRSRLAHRVSYEMTHGPIPEGLVIDHLCWNHACVNPQHLRLATLTMNAQNREGAGTRSTSGVRGVYWSEREKGWRPNATVNGWRPYLGIFATVEEAEAVVIEWRRTNMPDSFMDHRKAS